MYAHALSPFAIRNVTLRNRVVRAAHGTTMTGPSFEITDDLIAYHVARAKGGVALSTIEAAGVDESCPYSLDASTDAIIPQYRRLAAAVNPHGMRLFQQLWHSGGQNETPNRTASWSPSDIEGPINPAPSRPISREEIAGMVQAFADAAVRVQEGGIDGVEIHAAHGYLISQFLSPIMNRRDDEYGGSVENRMRFVTEILDAVRAAVGPDFIVGVRMSPEPAMPGGNGPAEVAGMAQTLVATGRIDYLSISSGTSYMLDQVFGGTHRPHRYEMVDSREVAAGIGVPRIVTGRFTSLLEVDDVVASGEADLVSMVRALIADPALVRKSSSGLADTVRACTGCNQACVGGTYTGRRKRLECTVSAEAGNETVLGAEHIRKASSRLHVAVVGGGPAGLEAARTAALVGHEVTLFEESDELGGQLRFLRYSELRAEMLAPVAGWAREIELAGVHVELGARVTSTDVIGAGVDAVILATGSRPRRDLHQVVRPWVTPQLADGFQVLSSWEILTGADPGQAVVVLDDLGHYEAIDVAEALLDAGREVTFVTRFPTVGARLEGDTNGWEVMARPHLERLMGFSNFHLCARTLLTSAQDDYVTIESLDSGSRVHRIKASSIVPVSRNIPDRRLLAEVARSVGLVRVAGDAAGSRMLRLAVVEGHIAALSLDPVTMPHRLPPGSGGGHIPWLGEGMFAATAS
jgi:2,4-dienoyl-CoA reductase-like NADH-dependent reductase (Old Yellow Enzyme family)